MKSEEEIKVQIALQSLKDDHAYKQLYNEFKRVENKLKYILDME